MSGFEWRPSMWAAAVLAVSASLAGCTSGGDSQPSDTTSTIVSTVTATRAPQGADYTPPVATTVAPRPRSGEAPTGEKKGRCPYLRSGLNEDPVKAPNFAEIEGNRVGLTTVITGLSPVGCRFYFAYDRHAVGDIVPTTFSSSAYARAAMIKTANAGRNARGYPGFVAGVDGINYQTAFYGPDHGKDWAFVFAKGKVMVVIRTDQNDSPLNALYLARAIVAKF